MSVVKSFSFALAAKAWGAFYVPLQLLLIPLFFSPLQQGYYYTFSSLLALQAFAELGFTNVILYFTAHEWQEGGPSLRFIQFGRATFFWYLLASLFFFLLLLGSGLWLFREGELPFNQWFYPYLALASMAGINLLTLPALAMLEGINRVKQVYFVRLGQSLIVGSITLIGIYAKCGLWVPSLALFGLNLWTLLYLRIRQWEFFKLFLEKTPKCFHWRKELLPLQYKSALIALSVYFSYCLINPLVFHFFGPIPAGQLGMTLALASALTQVATLLLNIYKPRFAPLILHQQKEKLCYLFKKIVGITTLVILGLTLLSLVLVKYPLFEGRFLPTPLLEIFLLANILFTLSLPWATFMRSYREEPLVKLSLIIALLTTLGNLYLSFHSTLFFIGLNLVFMNFCNLILTYKIWNSFTIVKKLL